MASFMSNIFAVPGKDNGSKPDLARPSTPIRNTFVEPVSTPHGSPSKRTFPPGAHELPQALESSLKLTPSVFDTPIKLGRPQSVVRPLSPAKGNSFQHADPDTTIAGPPDESILQKGPPTTPLRHQGQENTPPATTSKNPPANPLSHNHPALSRHDIYQIPRTVAPAKRFDTSRGLTQEEKDILQKPNVRRLVNVTQLCKSLSCPP